MEIEYRIIDASKYLNRELLCGCECDDCDTIMFTDREYILFEMKQQLLIVMDILKHNNIPITIQTLREKFLYAVSQSINETLSRETPYLFYRTINLHQSIADNISYLILLLSQEKVIMTNIKYYQLYECNII